MSVADIGLSQVRPKPVRRRVTEQIAAEPDFQDDFQVGGLGAGDPALDELAVNPIQAAPKLHSNHPQMPPWN